MSAATFGPAQVAMVTIEGNEHTAIRDSNGAWLVGDLENLRVVHDVDDLVTGVFPLFVLDVRKPKKVSDLEKAIAHHDSVIAAVVSLTQKPAEPTGFGAVVLDVNAKRWLRDGLEDDEGGAWFHGSPPRASDWERRDYDQIAVVEVLQMGVPA